MCTDPVIIIDKIIENLKLLSELTTDDPPEKKPGPRRLTPEDRKRKQASKAIDSLIPRLRNALGDLRQAGPPDTQGTPSQRSCVNCED
jgi:hypothetical protein